MEPRFAHDFSRVRVHTDSTAAHAATALQARAFTIGRDVVFNANEYAPTTTEGRRLLAHELAHVVQQTAGEGVDSGIERGKEPGMVVRRQPDAPDATNGGATAAAPPVFVCSKNVALGYKHAFFRIGGPEAGHRTYELEHDEIGDHCPCGIQGWPTHDYPEDRDSTDATCVAAPALSAALLDAFWNIYPIGRYCAWGPNSNTYAHWLATMAGDPGAKPPGSLPGWSDAPPKAGTATKETARFTILDCPEIKLR
jgi:hypothetical protein